MTKSTIDDRLEDIELSITLDTMKHVEKPDTKDTKWWQNQVHDTLQDSGQALYQDLQELVGEPEERETTDMSLKSWTVDDYKAFGKNELKIELQAKLKQYFGKE